MNEIKIRIKSISDIKIEYALDVQGPWKKYFEQVPFYAEYTCKVDTVPKSIAILPALGSILPMAWVLDAHVQVEELDKDFYDAIPDFKKGYEQMFPKVRFCGSVSAEKLVEMPVRGTKVATLFSGGVDAFTTLLSHANEKPDLITIWGADVHHENETAWEKVRMHLAQVVQGWQLDSYTIRSSFRQFLNEGALSSLVSKDAKDDWWHGFQHGLGMFGLCAPLAYVNGYQNIYIASSFTAENRGQYTCASDPTIDNYVRFCGCSIVHDGYEMNRQDKIQFLCEYAKAAQRKIPLRVCWESKDGSNCCLCEKCFRTMLGIYAEKQHPSNFGFGNEDASIEELLKCHDGYFVHGGFKDSRYHAAWDRIQKNYTRKEISPVLYWFYDTEISKLVQYYKNKERKARLLRRIKRIPGRVMRWIRGK